MEAILGIFFSAWILIAFYKSERRKRVPDHQRNTVKARWDRNQRRKDEELIAAIIPTIENK